MSEREASSSGVGVGWLILLPFGAIVACALVTRGKGDASDEASDNLAGRCDHPRTSKNKFQRLETPRRAQVDSVSLGEDAENVLAPEMAKFALSECIRTIEQQEGGLERIRGRAISVLGFSTTVAVFLAGTILGQDDLDKDNWFWVYTWTVVVLGVLLTGFTGATIWSVKAWTTKIQGIVLVDSYGAGTPRSYRELVKHYTDAAASNAPLVASRRRRLEIVMALAFLLALASIAGAVVLL